MDIEGLKVNESNININGTIVRTEVQLMIIL